MVSLSELGEYVLRLLTIVAWPLTVLIIAFAFRTSLRNLLTRLSEVGFGSASARFEKNLDKAEAIAPKAAEDVKTFKVRTPGPKKRSKQTSGSTEAVGRQPAGGIEDRDLGQLLELTERDPTLALAGLRIELEKMLAHMVEMSFNMEHVRHVKGAGNLLTLLTNMEVIPRSLGRLVEDILRLCNAAVHGKSVDADSARRVITLASEFQGFYKQWLVAVPSTASAAAAAAA